MRLVPILALVLLGGCRSAPESKLVPSGPANIEQLLKFCQQQTGTNFTYSAETGRLLREHGFRLEGSDPRTAEAWLETLRGVLGAQELELVPIGPADRHVFLIQPLRKGA